MTSDFDQNAYWIDRHEDLKGDPRSVGNLADTVAANRIGESRLMAATTWAARDLKPYSNVLDIGCGYGRVAPCFCEAGYAYTGLDVAPAAIDAARNREPRGRYFLGSAQEFESRRKFNLICAFYVFVHFVDDQDWQALIHRIADLLNIGGALLIADHFPEVEARPDPHVVHRPLSHYVKELKRHGLARDGDFQQRYQAAWQLYGTPPPFELFRKLPD